jgi:hypothetical protein
MGMSMVAGALDWHVSPTGPADGDGSKAKPFREPASGDRSTARRATRGDGPETGTRDLSGRKPSKFPLPTHGASRFDRRRQQGGDQRRQAIEKKQVDRKWTAGITKLEGGPVRELFVNGNVLPVTIPQNRLDPGGRGLAGQAQWFHSSGPSYRGERCRVVIPARLEHQPRPGGIHRGAALENDRADRISGGPLCH